MRVPTVEKNPLNTGEIKYWNSTNMKYYTRLGFSGERHSELAQSALLFPPVLPKFAGFCDAIALGTGRSRTPALLSMLVCTHNCHSCLHCSCFPCCLFVFSCHFRYISSRSQQDHSLTFQIKLFWKNF